MSEDMSFDKTHESDSEWGHSEDEQDILMLLTPVDPEFVSQVSQGKTSQIVSSQVSSGSVIRDIENRVIEGYSQEDLESISFDSDDDYKELETGKTPEPESDSVFVSLPSSVPPEDDSDQDIASKTDSESMSKDKETSIDHMKVNHVSSESVDNSSEIAALMKRLKTPPKCPSQSPNPQIIYSKPNKIENCEIKALMEKLKSPPKVSPSLPDISKPVQNKRANDALFKKYLFPTPPSKLPITVKSVSNKSSKTTSGTNDDKSIEKKKEKESENKKVESDKPKPKTKFKLDLSKKPSYTRPEYTLPDNFSDILSDEFSDIDEDETWEDIQAKAPIENKKVTQPRLDRATKQISNSTSISSRNSSSNSSIASSRKKDDELSSMLGFDFESSMASVKKLSESLVNLKRKEEDILEDTNSNKKKRGSKKKTLQPELAVKTVADAHAALKQFEDNEKISSLLEEDLREEQDTTEEKERINNIIMNSSVGDRIALDPKYEYFVDYLRHALNEVDADELFDFGIGMDKIDKTYEEDETYFSEGVVLLKEVSIPNYNFKEQTFSGEEICKGVKVIPPEGNLLVAQPLAYDIQSLASTTYSSFFDRNNSIIDVDKFYEPLIEGLKKSDINAHVFPIDESSSIYNSFKNILNVQNVNCYRWRNHKYDHQLAVPDNQFPFTNIVLRLRRFVLNVMITMNKHTINQDVINYRNHLVILLFRLIISHLVDFRTVRPNVSDYAIPGMRSNAYHDTPTSILNKLLMQLSVHYLVSSNSISDFGTLLKEVIIPILDDFADVKLIYRFIRNLTLVEYPFIKDLKSYLSLYYLIAWDYNDDDSKIENDKLKNSNEDGYDFSHCWKQSLLTFECDIKDNLKTSELIIRALYKYLGKLCHFSLKPESQLKISAFSNFNKGFKEFFEKNEYSYELNQKVCLKNARFRLLLLSDLITIHYPNFTKFDKINHDLESLYASESKSDMNGTEGSKTFTTSLSSNHKSLSATPVIDAYSEDETSAGEEDSSEEDEKRTSGWEEVKLPKLHMMPNVEKNDLLLAHFQSYLMALKSEYFRNYQHSINPIITDCQSIFTGLISLLNRGLNARETFF